MTLTQRIVKRDTKAKTGSMGFYATLHVRAELNRLARQVRNGNLHANDGFLGRYILRKDVLRLIREAGK